MAPQANQDNELALVSISLVVIISPYTQLIKKGLRNTSKSVEININDITLPLEIIVILDYGLIEVKLR